MAKSLIIVESPAKARTISRIAGRRYSVVASNGHVRDLPKSKLGVEVDKDFEPQYVTIRKKSKIIKELREKSKGVEEILLAPDPDREGEAIAWHLMHVLGGDRQRFRRLVFHEITKRAIREALATPREIDMHKVDAQQGRRVLDRLVGYQLSPVLWRTVRYGLSAGRVQSVALRIIVDRERRIEAFVPVEYWTIQAFAETQAGVPLALALVSWQGKKPELGSEAEAQAVIDELAGRPLAVVSIRTRRRRRNAAPPFITSTLQQEAFRKLRFPSRKTMQVAQELYEGIVLGEEGSVGLITYMRTDSTRMAEEALKDARDYIAEKIGSDYLPEEAVRYRRKGRTQEAHEAIRPTSAAREPQQLAKYLSREQLRLYTLIWKRFVACQMRPQELDITTVDAACDPAVFRVTGKVIVFDGFTRLYESAEPARPTGTEENRADGSGTGDAAESGGATGKPAGPAVPADEIEADSIPALKEGEELSVREYKKKQHFTEPPPRYSEASLIRVLEEKGIGRPSTYATIVGTILTRDYVRRDKGRLLPTELGKTVVDLLVANFADIMDVGFTAHMEEELDRIEEGRDAWVDVVREFYVPFKRDLDAVEKKQASLKESIQVKTDETCEKCGAVLVRKFGRHGPFLACSNYPECRYTRPFEEDEKPQATTEKCPTCNSAMLIRTGRFGRFLACEKYPECKTTLPVPTGVACPEEGCDGALVEKRTRTRRVFYGCNRYPDCRYAVWDRPVPRACPQCAHPLMVERETRRDGPHDFCPACKTKVLRKPEPETQQEAQDEARQSEGGEGTS
jgi:DNA topoisomerase-1